MLPLHPELRARLIDHHDHINTAEQNQKLTSEVLDIFEELVNRRFQLRQISKKQLRINWRPFPTSRFNSFILCTPSANQRKIQYLSPFGRLLNAQPSTAKDALDLLEDSIQELIDRFMPDFYVVHNHWAIEHGSREIGNANRGFKGFWRTKTPAVILIVILVGLYLFLLSPVKG